MRSSARLLIAVIVMGATLCVSMRPAPAFPSGNVELEGHGWGHGRGMGQYGALGYALDHGWSSEQILNHFYGNTAGGSIENLIMSVRMMQFDAKDTIVVQEQGKLKTSADGEAGLHTALLARRVGGNRFRVFGGPGCGGPWTPLVDDVGGPVRFYSTLYNDSVEDHSSMLQVCEAAGTRWLRGELQSVDDAGTQRTVNHLTIEAYLRGVVPRESPASWGDLGGGKGMEALKAQSVAARSYAASENRYPGYAKTCDTTACQVYGGRAQQGPGPFTDLEPGQTDTAVAQTAGRVRKTSGGQNARTEFSSSTGGHSAGGAFPAVPDDGDKVGLNPNHTWRTTIPVSAIEAAWPQIGNLASIAITQRNGLGDWGGRVVATRIEGSSGVVTPNGEEVRQRLGLKSNWFRVLYPGGYWMVAADGGIFAFGSAPYFGSMGGRRLNSPIVAIAATPATHGYWMVASDGGVFSFGSAQFHGSTGGMKLNRPIVGMATTPSGNGYWFVASDGGIFAFGDARFHGSTGSLKLNQPIVAMAATRTGGGYWLVASDGGVFAFGDARFYGSTGGVKLNQPIVGTAALPASDGYWFVAADGGIFSFGSAPFHGSASNIKLASSIAEMSATPTGGGYWLVAADGGIFNFGDAAFFGSASSIKLASPIVGLAAHKV